MNPIPHAHGSSASLIAAVLLSAVSALYIAAGVRSSRRCKRWPLSRYICWIAAHYARPQRSQVRCPDKLTAILPRTC